MKAFQSKKDGKAVKERSRKKKKRTALIVCRNGTRYWTTQSQFWQWVRDLKIVKIKDFPLTGKFSHPYEELMVSVGNSVLNLAHRNHLREALASRRYAKQKVSR